MWWWESCGKDVVVKSNCKKALIGKVMSGKDGLLIRIMDCNFFYFYKSFHNK